ncbi:SGNH/GDSL hydrolase family protein [Variovorax ginsengisoli]|uniref:SGNH/GDSL hydrolase family protein n=1 Tax=Variovorax ginsengisoli TaxID=363844 RepID=A0ABT8RY56_9BURK|nr:SGNH/GDSL hydrolase family protein [Variovorax ginsengisoli]MDN8612429.1 SGNH/GDSL hydrolase family protein [Variovorax ginsengisoli]MDO1531599.1 SGNH/GDSL hydrolase family protein [Variovorax ginsengisoli]
MKAAARLALVSLAFAGMVAAQAEPLPGSAAPGPAATPSPAYSAARARWQGDLAAFAAADREQLPEPGGVVFVGSSTIRMWSRLAQDFNQQPVVVNRGFGGSTMADCSLFASELVVRYRPRLVLVYAGDNDLAEGRTPLQVLESFAQFASTVRAALPDTRIAYISVKPSPSREKLLPGIRETNNVIGAYLKRLPNSDYIDVFTPMLAADGRPRAELFRGDRLHLNDEGYRLWQSVIASHLQETTPTGTSVAQGAR